MPLVVARTATPIAQTSLPGLIAAAFEAERLPLPGISRMMLAVLAAIETDRGRAVMNHNLGNITANDKTETIPLWRPPWFDPVEAAQSPRLQRLHQEMLAGRAPRAFRAYRTREEGARDFARQLARSFPEVLRAATVPDADAFRVALSEKYSKDYRNPAATKSLAQLMKEYGITTTGIVAATSAGSLVTMALLLYAAYRLLK